MLGSTPLTITSKEQSAVLPDSSLTSKVLVVVPIGNVEPFGRPAICAVVGVQLSEPTGSVNVTTAPAALVAYTSIFNGQVMIGSISS